MNNTPFRFLDSLESLRRLRKALGKVGLTEEPATQGLAEEGPVESNLYHPAYMRFACPWLSEPVELQWHYYWWPDGIVSELDRVSVVYEGAARAKVNVQELLQRKLDRPLAEAVIEGIVAACDELTGKRRRASKRGR